MWWGLANVALLWLVGLVAWYRGYRWGERRGREAGNRAHEACHAAQRAVRDAFLASVIEHADMEAWEEEL